MEKNNQKKSIKNIYDDSEASVSTDYMNAVYGGGPTKSLLGVKLIDSNKEAARKTFTKTCFDFFAAGLSKTAIENITFKPNLIRLDAQDKSGRTILHWLVMNFFTDPNVAGAISQLFKNKDKSFGKYIDICDDNGKTVIHYAAKIGADNLVDFFKECGGNLSLKDNAGDYIKIVQDDESENQPSKKRRMFKHEIDIAVLDTDNALSMSTINMASDAADSIVESIKQQKISSLPQSQKTNPIQKNVTDKNVAVLDTENAFDLSTIVDSIVNDTNVESDAKHEKANTDTADKVFISDILNKFQNENQEEQTKNQTDEFSKIINEITDGKIVGGSITGKRFLKSHSKKNTMDGGSDVGSSDSFGSSTSSSNSSSDSDKKRRKKHCDSSDSCDTDSLSDSDDEEYSMIYGGKKENEKKGQKIASKAEIKKEINDKYKIITKKILDYGKKQEKKIGEYKIEKIVDKLMKRASLKYDRTRDQVAEVLKITSDEKELKKLFKE